MLEETGEDACSRWDQRLPPMPGGVYLSMRTTKRKGDPWILWRSRVYESDMTVFQKPLLQIGSLNRTMTMLQEKEMAENSTASGAMKLIYFRGHDLPQQDR